VFASGCYFIATVWGVVTWENESTLAVMTFFLFFILCGLLHLFLWKNTTIKLSESARSGKVHSFKYKTALFAPHDFKGIQDPSMKNMQDNKEEEDGEKEAGEKEDEQVEQEEQAVLEDTDDLEADPQKSAVTFQEPDTVDEQPPNEQVADIDMDMDERVDMDEEEEEEKEVVTNCDLFRMHCCGQAETLGEREPKTCFEKILSALKWVTSIFVNALFFYLIIVNVGATQQMLSVRKHLPTAFKDLYPPDYITGTMCAWDQAGPNAIIKTFDTLEAVYAANYTVIHCGACADCSNWNDLGLEWTTKGNLAAMAQTCAKKSLFGTIDDVQQCNEDLIGFTPDCAMCWTVDELCSKKNCVFIFLQGVMINNIGNFQVGLEHVTSASCDEAICGPEFVPCSGATRRRMNIVSDIPRPIEQQCPVAEENWSEIF
jgi:hypothetical protein